MGLRATPGTSREPGKGEGHRAGACLSSAGGALPPALQVGDTHTRDACEHDPVHRLGWHVKGAPHGAQGCAHTSPAGGSQFDLDSIVLCNLHY
jgi:hypothetical protein